MKVYAKTSGGWKQLPELTGWEVCRSDLACDSFRAVWPADPALRRRLYEAQEVFFGEGGDIFFRGLPDEVQETRSGSGALTELTGRGFAARLLDTQTPGAEFPAAQPEDILERYVRPLGLAWEIGAPLPAVENFLVETGSSCYAALTGFLRRSAGLQPRFREDGTLLIAAGEPKSRVVRGGYTRLQLRQKRYGVPAELWCVDARTGLVRKTENPPLQALAVQSRSVVTKTSRKEPASWREPEERLQEAMQEFETAELTLPGRFLASPGDIWQLDLPEADTEGRYLVLEVLSRGDADGEYCRVLLRPV